jgi:hypothetical protein
MRIVRSCKACKKPVILNDENRDYIFISNRFMHLKCFVDYKTNLKSGAWSIERCNLYIEDVAEITKQKADEIISSNKKVEVSTTPDEKSKHKKQLDIFYAFITEKYDLSVIPKYFFTKIASIENGTYKQVTKPIPITDIYDMWQQKISYLDKVAVKNAEKGNKISGINRVNYDLAILLSRYDSYLDWKERQKVTEKEIIDKTIEVQQMKVTNKNIVSKTQNINKNTLDIDSILDEI